MEENHDYREHYIKILRKIAFLVGYINFSKSRTNNLILKIFEIYPKNERDGKEVLFDTLIQNRIKYISRKNAITYIESFYQKEIDYSFNITNIFNLLEHFKTIKLKPNQIEFFFFEDIRDRTGYYKSYILYRLYRYGDKTIKSRVLQTVEETLNKQITFDYRMLGVFIRENIIPNSEKYFETFSNIVINKINTEKETYYQNPINRDIKNLDCFNQYINYIYDNYDTPYNYLKEFLGRSDYYDFLINPNGFNFNKFDIHWFYIAYRKSYFAIKKIIKNNKKITKFILKEISKSENNNYHKAYVSLMSHIYEDIV